MVNALVEPLIPVYAAAVESANGLALKIKAATSGKDEKVQAVLSTSDDEEIAKWRANDERLRKQIAEVEAKLAEAKVNIAKRAETLLTETDDFDVEKGKSEFLSKRQDATSIRKTILVLLGNDEKALTEAIEKAGIVEILSLRGSAGRTSGATGKRKPRLTSATVNGEDQGEKVSFTTLAQKIGIDVDTLKAAAFKAAETEDLSGDKAGETVSFTVTNKKSETVQVTIVPKASASVTSDDEKSDDESDESDEVSTDEK